MITYDMSAGGRLPLYEYLFQCIRADIQSGALAEHERLPSRRKLAQHLSVSIGTVESAYGQLQSAGYIYSTHKSGYFVSPGHGTGRYVPEFYECELPERESRIDFKANKCSMELFPMNTWARLMRQVLSVQDASLLKTVPFAGLYELRRAIAVYLYENKGMRVSPSQIVVGAGTEFLYGRLLQLFGSQSVIAMEDPGYKKFAQLSASYGIRWDYIPMDESGIRIDLLNGSEANLVHVSPANHFPTGIVMSRERRAALLAWAAAKEERYIIEDDYDSELRFEGKALPTLFSQDSRQRVIYLNTFSKTLVPSLRISYMVLPEALMDLYRKRLSFYSCSVSSFEQCVLAKFISEGYFERHISKLRRYYRRRKNLVLHAIAASAFGRIASVRKCQVGTHFLVNVKTALSDAEIRRRAKAQDIELALLSDYSEHPAPETQGVIVLNFANLDEENIQKAMELLGEIFKEDIEKGG